jgi:hypothetical protein
VNAAAAARLVALAAILVVGYGPLDAALRARALRLTEPRSRFARQRPKAEAMGEIAIHGLVLAFGAAAGYGAVITAVSWRQITLTPLGLLLGPAEAGLALLGCAVAADVAVAVAARAEPSAPPYRPGMNWLGLMRGNWMRRSRQLFGSRPLAGTLVLLSARFGGEEMVFRGIVLTALRPAGPLAAVAVSASAYVAYGLSRPQARGASRDAAATCALIGVVHGILFWNLPMLAPLIAAHIALYALIL